MWHPSLRAPWPGALGQFAGQGARVLPHGPFRDDLTLLHVREATLRDPAKAAALSRHVAVWVRANQWIEGHHEEWAQLYWRQDQRLSDEDARYQVEALGPRYTPEDFGQAIQIERSVIELMAPATQQRTVEAQTLFDRRFEAVIRGAQVQARAHDTTPPGPVPPPRPAGRR